MTVTSSAKEGGGNQFRPGSSSCGLCSGPWFPGEGARFRTVVYPAAGAKSMNRRSGIRESRRLNPGTVTTRLSVIAGEDVNQKMALLILFSHTSRRKPDSEAPLERKANNKALRPGRVRCLGTRKGCKRLKWSGVSR